MTVHSLTPVPSRAAVSPGVWNNEGGPLPGRLVSLTRGHRVATRHLELFSNFYIYFFCIFYIVLVNEISEESVEIEISAGDAVELSTERLDEEESDEDYHEDLELECEEENI